MQWSRVPAPSSVSKMCAFSEASSSQRTRGQWRIPSDQTAIKKSTISTPSRCMKKALKSSGCCRPLSGKQVFDAGWTSISLAMTDRQSPAMTSSRRSRTPTSAILINSGAGTKRLEHPTYSPAEIGIRTPSATRCTWPNGYPPWPVVWRACRIAPSTFQWLSDYSEPMEPI